MSIENVKYNRCCGCGACANICPKKCIDYVKDEEGFFYPKIDEEKCIKCNLCEKVCPTNQINNNNTNINTYVGYAKSDEIKKESSSGGIFAILAEYVLAKNGVVYGAAFNDVFELNHIRICDRKELSYILTSKYVQSNIIDVYKLVIKDLKAQKLVLFCGTPCQIHAIKNSISKKELLQNLILVDFICHGVPSPGIWKSYKLYIEKKRRGKLEKVSFRDKYNGWHDYSFSAIVNNKCFRESHDLNAYMRTFLSNKNIRPSCYNCFVKPDNYVSDITLGDAWKIEKEKSEWADDKGTSLIITRSQKGELYLKAISKDINMINTDYNKWCKFNPSLYECTRESSERNTFFDEFKENDYLTFWKNNSKMKIKIKVKYQIKKILKILKLEKIIRKFI